MALDPLTLMAVGSFVMAVCAVLLATAWTQIHQSALLSFAAANVATGIGVGCMAIGLSSGPALLVVFGAFCNALSPMMVWAGTQRFNRRKPQVLVILAVTALLLGAGFAEAAGVPNNIAALPSFAVWPVFLGLAIYELWKGRHEHLAARIPLGGFLALHGLVFVGGVLDLLAGWIPRDDFLHPMSSIFSAVHFESLVYCIGMSVFMVLLCKQRSESAHIVAARYDSLTGVSNRGPMIESAERALRRCQAEGMSYSLAIFDLDQFKRINDTFGHDIGDMVLRTFADVTRTVLRPHDLVGRLGGEEFVAALPGATAEAAYVIADRIRQRFQEKAAAIGSLQINATVSAGVAGATSTTDLQVLMRQADRALYLAKDLGRNRVERGVRAEPEQSVVIARIA